jgi:hypothetical protein
VLSLDKIFGAYLSARLFADLIVLNISAGQQIGAAIQSAAFTAIEARKYYFAHVAGETIETRSGT